MSKSKREVVLQRKPKSQAESEVQSSPAGTADVSDEPDALYSNIQVEVRGHDTAVLKSYDFFVTEAAKLLRINHTR